MQGRRITTNAPTLVASIRPARLLLTCLAAALILVQTVAGGGFASGPAGAQTSDDLDRKAVTLATEQEVAVGESVAAVEALDRLRLQLDAAQVRFNDAVASENDAIAARLGAYAIVAYVGNGSDDEGQLVLVESVAANLVDARRQTELQATAAERDVQAIGAEVASAEQRVTAAKSRIDELAGDLSTTLSAAQSARVAEAEEAERDAAALAQSRVARLSGPGDAPPNQPSVIRSGVVPRTIAPSELAILLSIEMPRTSLEAYWRASQRLATENRGCALDWALLGGIGLVETRHGTYLGSNPNVDGSVTPPIVGIAFDGSRGTVEIRDSDGGTMDGDPVWDRAVGPMQFIPATWRAFGADGNGDGSSDPHNIFDAAVAAGRYLCHAARGNVRDPEVASWAVRAYNNSEAYVIEVLAVAEGYRSKAALGDLVPDPPESTVPGATTTTAIPSTTAPVTTTTGPPLPSTTTTTTASATTTTTATPPL